MPPDYPRHSDTDTDSPESSRRYPYGPHRRQFINKHGSKTHAYEPAKAPWPLSYDQATLELEMMDTALTSAYKGVVSLVDHKGKEPARCLDIGTGRTVVRIHNACPESHSSNTVLSTVLSVVLERSVLGLWVTQSAKYWRKSTFVGFDLVDVQIPLCILEPDEASRIEWVYGNILTGPLPFQDEEFDHVRITEVALGIPENKWTPVFEEVRRVMKPGATIEIIEEDAIFPVLPRWFTEPLHARTRWPSISMQDGAKFFSNPQITSSPEIAHEYELLEILFNKVFDRRFINTKPSSVLPAAFSTHFGHVISPPILTVPMPPLPPVQPRPSPRTSHSSRNSDVFADHTYLYDAAADGEMSLAALNSAAPRKGARNGTKSIKRQSTSSSPGNSVTKAPATSSPLVRSHSETQIITGSTPSASKGRRNGTASASNSTRPSRNASATSLHSSGHGHGHGNGEAPPPLPQSTTVTASGSPVSGPGSGKSSRASMDAHSTASHSSTGSNAASVSSMMSKRTAAIQDLAAVSTIIGERSQIEMFPIDALLMFDVHSLCLHLRRALGFVLAIREAMWEELQTMLTNPRRGVDLDKYGFFVHEDTVESMRAKFVQLLDQYKSDMHVRMSLWHSLRDPMSKAEEMEEMRLREDILIARRKAGAENEREPPCRAVRVLVGAKV
ncbi:hypothetical protein C8Q80DRAFT_1344601 [Daedaleopsis nitida]|nr:hypothetical protein C8Q80DRAFT_1344601 [Daedaleopsis nitida]